MVNNTRLAALALFAVASASAACGTASSAKLDTYFARIATLAATFDSASTTPAANGTFAPTEASLRTFANDLDLLTVPSEAKQAHHDLTVATKNLADLQHRILAGNNAPSTKEAALVRDWQTACHVLQDLALARKSDVDLRCATALHIVDSGG